MDNVIIKAPQLINLIETLKGETSLINDTNRREIIKTNAINLKA